MGFHPLESNMKNLKIIFTFIFISSTMSPNVWAGFLYQVTPEQAPAKVQEKLQHITEFNQLIMVLIEIEQYFAENPAIKSDFLKTAYEKAQRLAATSADKSWIDGRVKTLPTMLADDTKTEDLIKTLDTLEKTPSDDRRSAAAIFVYLNARRSELNGTKNILSSYVQGYAKFVATQSGDEELGEFVKIADPATKEFKKAKRMLAQIKLKNRAH